MTTSQRRNAALQRRRLRLLRVTMEKDKLEADTAIRQRDEARRVLAAPLKPPKP